MPALAIELRVALPLIVSAYAAVELINTSCVSPVASQMPWVGAAAVRVGWLPLGKVLANLALIVVEGAPVIQLPAVAQSVVVPFHEDVVVSAAKAAEARKKKLKAEKLKAERRDFVFMEGEEKAEG